MTYPIFYAMTLSYPRCHERNSFAGTPIITRRLPLSQAVVMRVTEREVVAVSCGPRLVRCLEQTEKARNALANHSGMQQFREEDEGDAFQGGAYRLETPTSRAWTRLVELTTTSHRVVP